MRPIEYLRIIRQRWWVLPITAVLGFAVAYASSSTQVTGGFAGFNRYRSSTTLISEPVSTNVNKDVNFDRVALLATRGEVPSRVATKLKLRREAYIPPAVPADQRGVANLPQTVVLSGSKIDIFPDATTGSLSIQTSASQPRAAAELANAFADELLVYIASRGQQAYQAQLQTLTANRAAVYARIAKLDAGIDAANAVGTPFNVAGYYPDRLAALNEIAGLDQKILGAVQSGPSILQFKVLEPADPNGALVLFAPSKSPSIIDSGVRPWLGALIGLGLGITGLLLIELVSVRVRDVHGLESAARMPVIAETPALRLDGTDGYQVAAAKDPNSLLAEAYRASRTSLVAMWKRHPAQAVANTRGNGNGNGNGNGYGESNGSPARPLRTLLVTSPGPSEGKSTTVVNLAAAFAETGATVIVLDGDFRRPQLDRYFGRSATPNLGDLRPDLTANELLTVIQGTGIRGVRFAASAPPKSHAPTAMMVLRNAAIAATELADLVIIDSPPLLLANDASDLSTVADATVLLARAGQTRRSALLRAADLLRRIEARTIGAVLIGAEHSTSVGFYGYYGYYGYGYDLGGPGSSLRNKLMPWRRPSRRSAPTAAPEPEAARAERDLVADSRSDPIA